MGSSFTFLRAVDLVGGAKLARALKISPQAVSKMVKKARDDPEGFQLPSDHVLPTAQETGWQLTPHELRPDLYPNERDAMPEQLAA